MKVKKIIWIICLIFAISMIVYGFILQSKKENTEFIDESYYDSSSFVKINEKTESQSHYQLQLSFSLNLPQEEVSGNYIFDINQQTHKQNISATLNKNGTVSWNATIDEFDNKYYYENNEQGITVSEMANVKYFFELMKDATEINANSFVIPKEKLEERLNSTSMPSLSDVKDNEKLIVDQDVTYYYEVSNQMLTKITSEFSINNGNLISVTYEFETLPDDATEN